MYEVQDASGEAIASYGSIGEAERKALSMAAAGRPAQVVDQPTGATVRVVRFRPTDQAAEA